MKRKVIIRVGIVVILMITSIIGMLLYMYSIGMGKGTFENSSGFTAVKTGKFEFLVDIKGDKDGTPVMLLHGFPESSAMWKQVMEDLSAKGYYCIAPNQRGYSPGATPKGASHYKLDLLRDDIIAIADVLALKKFHLVGHDWGSAVGWAVAGEYPDRLYSYTALSVPHITAFARSYREDDVQYKMSNYIRKFQTPLVVEYKLAKNNYAALKKIYSHHSQEEIDSYVNLFSRKGGLDAMLNWYRGNFSGFSEGFTIGNITVPTLFIWGNKDQAIARYGVELTKEYMKGPYRFIEINAGHWLIQEAYPSFSNEIVGHLKQYN